ncbi:MAG: CPBP family intramembrane glutamic endopeptidase [Limisphaerales bacterium]
MNLIAIEEEPERPVLTLNPWVVAVAWVVTLAVSLLPDVIWQMVTGLGAAWMLPAKLAFLGVVVVTGFVWAPVHPLRGYGVLLAMIFLTDYLRGVVGGGALWQHWFGGGSAGFGRQMFGIQVLRVAAASVMIGVLSLLGYRFRDFFLVKGDLNAPATPVCWLGMNKPVGWTRLGLISAGCISLGTLTFLLLGMAPSVAGIVHALPMLPVVVALAAMNAFAEELMFRGALLASLLSAVGRRQAVLLTAAFFGIAHYYGVPNGIVGVVMSGFLGWFLGKCMVETRGFVWPWFIHFVQDVLIFFVMAVGAAAAGGH